MSKEKTHFVCQECAAQYPKWQGKCSSCGQWNCLIEEVIEKNQHKSRSGGYAGVAAGKVQTLDKVELLQETVTPSSISEFDRVLGGGLVSGSVVLIGGDPGIGKSTLLLQTLHQLSSNNISCLYVSGEESPRQIGLRAQRLGLSRELISLYSQTQIEKILATAEEFAPQVLVVDSIQTLYSDELSAAPGAVSQLRECAARLVRYAKSKGTTVFLIGHVTKEGAIAGPRVLEHMVDTVLYFESEAGSRYRMLRAVKNRFGPVNELGMFAMLENGLKPVNNPSAIFLSRPDGEQSGSSIFPVWEGSRALLVEVQALVDNNSANYARRVTQGFDSGRLAMLLAVLNRHGGISMHDLDVYVNVVGGLRITETASDLAVLAAAVSSLRNRPIDRGTAIFAEVGLAGELRPIANGQERIKTAEQHGFSRIILPKANAPRKEEKKIEILPAQTLSEALNLLF